MQLGVRLAATLLALTWIAPVAQAATVLREFTLIDGTGRGPVPGSTPVVDGGRITWVGSTTQLRLPMGASVEQQLRICASYGVTAVQVTGTDHAIFDIRAGQIKAQPEMARVYTADASFAYTKLSFLAEGTSSIHQK